jgi:hypothetical protein
MIHPRLQTAPRNKVIEFIAEAFDAATITLVGIVGILTVAATI